MDIVRLGFRFSSFVIESEAGLINVVSVSSLAILSPPLSPPQVSSSLSSVSPYGKGKAPIFAFSHN